MTSARILCLGDLHLGVRPKRLPPGLDPGLAAVARVWERAVDLAVREEVGLVLLSGDVVHRDNRYFEAFGSLEVGLGRLADAGIEVCAVAGNHDFDVLPRLAGTVAGRTFHLLGKGGRWERFTWRDGAGRARLHVDGWSFPERNVRFDPVARYDLGSPGDDAPVVGLVHGELDRSDSTNAPLARAHLESAGGSGVAAWVLGHVHKPEVLDLSRSRWALYPGSPQPLDRTETGVHGGWLVEVGEDRVGSPVPAPLATLRWESLEVDLSAAGEAEAARKAVVDAVRTAAGELAAGGPGAPAWILLRATLTGRTRAHGALAEVVAELERGSPLELPAGDARARLVEVADRTRPAVDLEDLARGDGAPAVVAGLLLDLAPGSERSPGADERRLLAEAEEAARGVFTFRPYEDLPGRAPAGAALRDRTADAAWALLDALLAQKGDRPA